MKLKDRSKRMLAITKSKAKMYEFSVEESDHIELYDDPRKLLITTIGILGDLTANKARKGLSAESAASSEDLKVELISIGQYFDALIQSRLADELTTYLKIIGSAAYYLAGMPGSSRVLIKDFSSKELLTGTGLEYLLIWVLRSDYSDSWYRVEETYLTTTIDTVGFAAQGYFDLKADEQAIIDALGSLREIAYQEGSDRELLLADILSAVLLIKVKNSSIKCLPAYTQLTLDKWQVALSKPEFIQEFWPAQKILGEKGVLIGLSAVVQMPTSAGKTKSTELIIRSSFLSGRANVAVVVAPFRALCREITATFKQAFHGESVNVNELQDVLDVSVDEDLLIQLITGEIEQADKVAGKTIVITTPEKLVYLLRQEPYLADFIGLLIFDEGHQFDTGKRGVTYELLISYLKSRVPDSVQKVLISAVMANAHSIGEWLNGEAGVEIQGVGALPTIRSTAFASWKTSLGQLEYIDSDRSQDRSFFVPRVIQQYNLGKRGRERNDRFFPEKNNSSSVAAYLGVKLCHQGPAAVFCGVKSSVRTICKLIVDSFERGLTLAKPSISSDQFELEKIAYLSSLHFGENSIFTRSIKLGVLPHSSNIPNGIRVSVEWAMEFNKAVLVVCTSTLAQGVNLPIKYLIVSSTFQAGQEISTRDFHNLIGRAGRAGYYTEGSVIFADTRIYDKRNVFGQSWRWERALGLLDFSNAEDCVSSLLSLVAPFEYNNNTIDSLGFIENPNEYRKAFIEYANQRNIETESLLKQMDGKESLIEALESYFLSYLKDNPEASSSFFDELVQGTLAYFLSNDEKKDQLRTAFSHIAKRVSAVSKEKTPFWGRSLLGLKKLSLIESWINKNITGLQLIQTPSEVLVACWPLLDEINDSPLFLKIKPAEAILEFAKQWIESASYLELYNLLQRSGAYYQAGSQQRNITMDHVVELADNVLSFEFMLYVGAIADVGEGVELRGEVLENLRVLQSRLKLGLSNSLETWLYSQGYVDREVCKRLAAILHQQGVRTKGFSNEILIKYKQLVVDALVSFPNCFKILDNAK